MDIFFGTLALGLSVVYLVLSLASALRMYFVHGRYVHIEFARKKWRSAGEWAPQRYRWLNGLRGASVLFVLLWIIADFV